MFALPLNAGLKALDKQFNHWYYFTFSIASLLRWWYAPYMEYVLYGKYTIGQMHRDIDWRP